MSERRRAIIRVLETADESLSPKDITEMLNAKGVNISYGAVRELLSQMVGDGQVKNLGRGQYVLPSNVQNNADILTNGRGMSACQECQATSMGVLCEPARDGFRSAIDGGWVLGAYQRARVHWCRLRRGQTSLAGWAASFVGSSLVAAYAFWGLL